MTSLSTILSPRAITLLVFILVVLFLGATFNVQVGPESFVEGATTKPKQQPFTGKEGAADKKDSK